MLLDKGLEKAAIGREIQHGEAVAEFTGVQNGFLIERRIDPKISRVAGDTSGIEGGLEPIERHSLGFESRAQDRPALC